MCVCVFVCMYQMSVYVSNEISNKSYANGLLAE